MKTTHKIDIYMTRNRMCSLLTNFFLGTHWEGYHLVHHLFPGIPSWRYKEAHQILMKDTVYASLNQEKGWSSLIKQIMPPYNSST